MGATSPLDLLWITLAVGMAYAAIAWRFLVVPAQRRRAIAVDRHGHTVTRVVCVRAHASAQDPIVRRHLSLVPNTTSRS
jgi:hypothetical protein